MAFEYFFNENKRDIYDDQFEKAILIKCKNIILTSYSRFFDTAIDENGIPYPLNKDIEWSTLVEKYNQCFESYCNIKPDIILDIDNMRMHKEKYGLANYTFNFSYSYLSDSDWKRIVLGDSKDSMNRVESTRSIYENWSQIYVDYLSKGYYVFNKSGKIETNYIASNSGYIYILSNPEFTPNLYKIGFTSLNVELRSKQLYTTGVSSPFKIEKTYNTFDICRLETIIHEKLKIYRINKRREFFHCKKSNIIECIDSIINIENDDNH